jgi:hypothetical protein
MSSGPLQRRRPQRGQRPLGPFHGFKRSTVLLARKRMRLGTVWKER